MEEERKSSQQYGALDQTELHRGTEKSTEDVISMADSTVTIEDIEGELFRIERIREVLVRRESELRYMMDDIQLCKEITKLKQELQRLVTIPDTDKSTEDREKEEELLKQINKLVETRDFLVDDVNLHPCLKSSADFNMLTSEMLHPSSYQLRPAFRSLLKKKPSHSMMLPPPGMTLLVGRLWVMCSVFLEHVAQKEQKGLILVLFDQRTFLLVFKYYPNLAWHKEGSLSTFFPKWISSCNPLIMSPVPHLGFGSTQLFQISFGPLFL
uniref:Zgc:171844 n=1 Tax=Fundulus heteroclitus TaxID=8078 RepID=A0A3Q2PA11_FUNHE